MEDRDSARNCPSEVFPDWRVNRRRTIFRPLNRKGDRRGTKCRDSRPERPRSECPSCTGTKKKSDFIFTNNSTFSKCYALGQCFLTFWEVATHKISLKQIKQTHRVPQFMLWRPKSGMRNTALSLDINKYELLKIRTQPNNKSGILNPKHEQSSLRNQSELIPGLNVAVNWKSVSPCLPCNTSRPRSPRTYSRGGQRKNPGS